jgi:hypothetical protein
MKYVAGCLTVAFVCLFSTLSAQAAEIVSCECPKLGCDPCSSERGVKFYTEKCGPENLKVKSCARPTCIPLDTATKECPVPPQANSGPREPIVVKAAPAEEPIAPTAESASSIGKVKVLHGSVSIVHADGKKSVVTGDTELRESDTLESAKDGTALVTFNGGNKLHVHEDTKVEVKEFKDEKVEASRRALLNLIKGKVRSQVEQKYKNDQSSYFRIITKGAVAGVRGTDFVIEHHEDKKMETTVETLGGKVILASLDEKQTREIIRGEGARFVADLPDPSFKDKDMSEFIQRGVLSPVYKLTDDQVKDLEKSSRVDLAKGKSQKEAAICKAPKANFNQCSWRCSNNPAGSAKCRVDLPDVACIRARCNGNGDWAEETRLPDPSAPVLCPASGFLVKDCDY